MNYFVMVNGVVYLAASVYSIKQGHFLWGIIWVCYSVSAFVTCLLEGK